MKLTDTAIKAIKGNGSKQSYTDGGGLTLMVTAKGSKLWRLRYDRPNQSVRKQNDLPLGKYPTISLKAARELRDDIKKQIANGIDPAIKRKQDKLKKVLSNSTTVRLVAMQWHDLYKTKVSNEQAEKTLQRLNKNILSSIGNLPIESITTEILTKLIGKIVKRGALDIATRALSTCKEVFRFATVRGYISANPLINVKSKDMIPSRSVVNQKRVDVSDFPKLLNGINSYNGNQLHKLALRLMALVFVRHDELRYAEWSEFDFNKNEWLIPASKMKMNAPHKVPLSTQAITILEEIKKYTGQHQYLFASEQSSDGVMSEAAMLNVLYDLGYKGKQTVHGFRGLASTILNEQGYNPDHIESQLAHKDPNTTRGAYNHAQYLPHRVKIMQDWANHIDELTQK